MATGIRGRKKRLSLSWRTPAFDETFLFSVDPGMSREKSWLQLSSPTEPGLGSMRFA